MEYEDGEVHVTAIEPFRQQWDFVIENEKFGKLICSYYTVDEEISLDWFYDEVTNNKKGKNIIDGNALLACHETALEIMRRKIKMSLYDAMVGLLMETRLDVLRKLNGHQLALYNLDVTNELSKIRDYHSKASGARMGARSGKTPNAMAFLERVYKAYCSARSKEADKQRREFERRQDLSRELKLKVLRWSEFIGPEYITQEKLATEMNEGQGIPKNKLSDQTRAYGFTYKELIRQCSRWWKEERKRI